MLPIMSIRASALDHDIGALADWCASLGISRAAHGETTMALAISDASSTLAPGR